MESESRDLLVVHGRELALVGEESESRLREAEERMKAKVEAMEAGMRAEREKMRAEREQDLKRCKNYYEQILRKELLHFNSA